MAFLDENYLLSNASAKKIYQQIKFLPILDAHNHSNIQEIRDNDNYPDIWFVEAATDHYVWEMMRKRGVEEKFITGDAEPKEKWMELCKVFPDLVGNPCYEWVHLDLKRRLGIELLLNEENAEEIWDKTMDILQEEKLRPQAVLKDMNVEAMCSTDDPIDDLEHHKALQGLDGIKILPTWRPDKSMNIFKNDYLEYIGKLEKRVNKTFNSIDDLVEALQITHDYFNEMGTKASDHGIEVPYGYKVDRDTANEVFMKRKSGEKLSKEEEIRYMSYMFHKFGEMNAKSDWVMQIHIGAVRDVRDHLSESLGPDTGGDVSDHDIPILKPLKDFLNAFDGKLKVILYCLDPVHYSTLATLSRAFGSKVNMGAAWWFNDSPIGMRRQLEFMCSVDVLSNFAGMVTDSRKLMSYGSRTEMFRRVLSDVVGTMVERGQIPLELGIRTAKYVCYERKKELFNF